MTNPDDPINPSAPWDGSIQSAVTPRGLTKREWFAGMAIQAFHASKDDLEDRGDIAWKPLSRFAAHMAVELADALIAELNKQP